MFIHSFGLVLLIGCGFPNRITAQTNHAGMAPDRLATQDLKPIFNGTNLDGWIIRGGKATFTVVDGEIVGTCAVARGGNTFLCTERDYGDFSLELEIKADHGLNSGVQIRSQCFAAATTYDFGNRLIKIPADRVHGYQVEVDHRPERRWSGGIYEEARREWLFPLPTNSVAWQAQAFKFGDWNHYRIECRGASIKTWVNGIPAADLMDAESLKGFIGLQVHSADKPEYQVRFRNIRLRELGQHRWQTAWDCRSFDGLEKKGTATWELQDGILHAVQPAGDVPESRLVGQAGPSDFTIRMKYRVVQGAFRLDFRAETEAHSFVSYNYLFSDQVGATNVAKVNDWNTITASYQSRRMVWNLNGHQLSDTTSGLLHSASPRPGITLAGGQAAEVYFKDFEILSDAP